jgi:hypothetical protein
MSLSETQAPNGVARKPMPTLLRRTTMRRAIAEGVVLYAAGVLLALPQPDVWPAPVFIAVLLLRLALFILPPRRAGG